MYKCREIIIRNDVITRGRQHRQLNHPDIIRQKHLTRRVDLLHHTSVRWRRIVFNG